MDGNINWYERYNKTVDVFWNNFMFWYALFSHTDARTRTRTQHKQTRTRAHKQHTISRVHSNAHMHTHARTRARAHTHTHRIFMIFPGTSLATFQSFICRKIHKDTYLIASMYKEECPWGGENLQLYRLDTWSTLAFMSLALIFVYPIGIPTLMYFLMRFNGIPRLAKKKIGTSLINAMIVEFVKNTATSSSQRLASFLGCPPGLKLEDEDDTEKAENDVMHEEFNRRVQALFLEIFPEHTECGESCEGHQLPDLPVRMLQEMGYPGDLSALTLEARKWFARIDLDGSKSLDQDELATEFERIGLSTEEAKSTMAVHNAGSEGDEETPLLIEDFICTLIHVLGNDVESLAAQDVVTLAHLFDKYDEDGNGQIDPQEFSKLATDLVKRNFIFSGPETLDALNIMQLHFLRSHLWNRRKAEEVDEGADVSNATRALNKKKELFDAEKKAPAAEEQEEEPEPPERMYRVTREQEKQLKDICDFMKSTCKSTFPQDMKLQKSCEGLVDEETGQISENITPCLMDLRDKVKSDLMAVSDEDNCDYEPMKKASEATLNGHRTSSFREQTRALCKGKSNMYNLLLKVEKAEDQLKSILVDHVNPVRRACVLYVLGLASF